MWFLLQIPNYMNMNCLSEFSDIYDMLFRGEEKLPEPDLNSFMGVIELAALCFWINFNMKMTSGGGGGGAQNATASASTEPGAAAATAAPANAMASSSAALKSKPFAIPELLRRQYDMLQECMKQQNFMQYGLSVCLNACKCK